MDFLPSFLAETAVTNRCRSIWFVVLLVVASAGCSRIKTLATSTSTLPSGRVITATSDTGTISMYHDADICYLDVGIANIVIEPTVITVDGQKIPKRLDRFSKDITVHCEDDKITISSDGVNLCDINYREISN